MKINNPLIFSKLISLYGEETGRITFSRLESILSEFEDLVEQHSDGKALFSERDVVLITYGDLLKQAGKAPLNVLRQFFSQSLKDVINTIHILPFFPYSSDDGFSVIDYLSVDPELGDWQDIWAFGNDNVRLMFDVVINHISVLSTWFQKFLANDPQYRDYFITADPEWDYAQVTRPRTTPLITLFRTEEGDKWVWTTFSADQVDLNYQNPDVFLSIIEILLTYVRHGASLLRLDAIAYLWKEMGTNCIHLPQTHLIIQLIRAILDEIKKNILIITETNVPHRENTSYFGNGENEAHIVYQFSLPPLVAHAILTGNGDYLSRWAESLFSPSMKTTFLNFTASHDGIGVIPLVGILPDEERQFLFDKAVQHGGIISSKTDADGLTSPYELNITYFDLLNNNHVTESIELKVRRFLISQAIPLVLAGIPAIYFHSLLGTRNDTRGVEISGRPRSINRKKLNLKDVEDDLADPQNLRHIIFNRYRDLLSLRIRERVFHPNAEQKVIHLGTAFFALLRTTEDGQERILSVLNLTKDDQEFKLPADLLDDARSNTQVDLLTGERINVSGMITLEGYQMVWLKMI